MKKTMKITELRGLVKALYAALKDGKANKTDIEWESERSGQVTVMNVPSANGVGYGEIEAKGKSEDAALKRLAKKLLNETVKRTNRMLTVASGARKALGPSIRSPLVYEFSTATRIFRAAMRSKTGGA